MFENLCEYIKTELSELDRKAKNSKLSAAELEYADTLAHLKKSLLTVDAMEEADGYSHRYYPMHSYRDEWDGHSYAGRMNARRDSMGRYSRTGYSYHDSMDELLDEMRGMLDKVPEDRRRKAERLIDELSR